MNETLRNTKSHEIIYTHRSWFFRSTIRQVHLMKWYYLVLIVGIQIMLNANFD